jgi:hypothetical protein
MSADINLKLAGVNVLLLQLLHKFCDKVLALVYFWKPLILFEMESPTVAQLATLFHMRFHLRILVINLSTMSTTSTSRDFGLSPMPYAHFSLILHLSMVR